MPKIQSRTGLIRKSAESIYNFVSDFRNLEPLIPADRVQDWNCTDDTCSFTVMGLGRAGLRITEKNPYTFMRVNSDENTSVKFQLGVDINPLSETSSELKLTLDPDINPIMLSMVGSQLKGFLDMLITEIEKRVK